MSPLRSLSRDLVERKLWPVVAALVVALVALPALFLHPGGSGAPAATAPPAQPRATSTTVAATPDLPQAVRQLIDQTTSAIPRGTKVPGALKDPFHLAGANGLSKTAPAPASSSPASSPQTSAHTLSASTATPTATLSSLPTTPPAVPASTPASTPAAQPAAKPAPAPHVAPAKPQSYVVYRTDLRYGPDDSAKVATDVARLTAFPSATDPVVVFLGLDSATHDAIFAVRSDSRPTGAQACRPLATLCLWLDVKAGAHVDLQVPDGKGQTTPERLSVVRVTRDTTSDSAAAHAAYERASAAGRCTLGVQAAYQYDDATGLLSENPAVKDCQYAQPQGKVAPAQAPGYLG